MQRIRDALEFAFALLLLTAFALATAWDWLVGAVHRFVLLLVWPAAWLWFRLEWEWFKGRKARREVDAYFERLRRSAAMSR